MRYGEYIVVSTSEDKIIKRTTYHSSAVKAYNAFKKDSALPCRIFTQQEYNEWRWAEFGEEVL